MGVWYVSADSGGERDGEGFANESRYCKRGGNSLHGKLGLGAYMMIIEEIWRLYIVQSDLRSSKEQYTAPM